MSFVSYAQNFEDVMLWRALQHVGAGFYIDVGANHPSIDSVTCALYERGWSGINIEPLPEHIAQLQTMRPRDINLQIAAGAAAGEIELYVPDVRGLATANREVIQQHEAKGMRATRIRVPVRPLHDICAEYRRDDIHFLKIDVEGFEAEVLQGMDFERFRPWLLVVEATIPNSPELDIHWEPLILAAGYRHVYFDGLNRYYLAEEHPELEAHFRAPPNVFDHFIVADTVRYASLLEESQRQAKEQEVAALSWQGKAEHWQDKAELLQEKAEHWQDKAELLKEDILLLHNSTSWRVTRPLRELKHIARGDFPWIRLFLASVAQKKLPVQPSALNPELKSPRPSQILSSGAAQIYRVLQTRSKNIVDRQADASLPAEKRLRLAYVYSPDNAEYHAELLPILNRSYEIDIIGEQAGIDEAWISEHGPASAIRTVEWFRAHAGFFDRVLYHFGDSPSCRHLFDLLEEIPGVIVLHDFSLSEAQASRETPHVWEHALQASHGYPALLANQADKSAAIALYPANLPVLQAALGVIVHSEEVCRQGEAWYGQNAAATWTVLPIPDSRAAEDRVTRYAEAIESHYLTSPEGQLHRLLSELEPGVTEQEMASLAVALSENFPPAPKKRQLFVDISALVEIDNKTGIQRVVRATLREWFNRENGEWQVEPVYASDHCYRHARRFTSHFLGIPDEWADDAPVEAWAGDIFFALDFHSTAVIADKAILEKWRDRGVKIGFLVFDLLPVSYPECFPEGAEQNHQEWLKAICAFDFSICISRSVAEELQQWMAASDQVKRQRPYRIEWSHIGADLVASVPTRGIPPNGAEQLDKLRASPSFLMVGTIEPRKRYREVLEVFEQLWAKGKEINLVIVGKKGWKQDTLIQRLNTRMAQEKRLIWLEGVSDEYLEAIYAASVCLIAASCAEGFGLPLIEAARHKLPVIARDIPVFREVAGQHAHYFSSDLANSIETWLALHAQNKHPKSDPMPWLTWQESAERLWCLVTAAGESSPVAPLAGKQ
jgi:FkbM family methyltransferase